MAAFEIWLACSETLAPLRKHIHPAGFSRTMAVTEAEDLNARHRTTVHDPLYIVLVASYNEGVGTQRSRAWHPKSREPEKRFARQ